MTPRRVAIDARMLHHAGIGTYVRHLVPRVIARRPEWHFLVLAPRAGTGDWTLAPNATVVRARSDIYGVVEQVELPLRVMGAADVLWAPHYNVPVLSPTPLVVTVHDVSHLAMAHWYGGLLRDLYARRMYDTVRRRAREVIFVSEFSRSEFVQRVGEPRRSATIHNGVDAAWWKFAATASPSERPYVLFVGSIKPHKNLSTLLRAFDAVRDRVPHDLVIIGDVERQRRGDADALAHAARLGDRVRVVGRVDDTTLKRYVANAAALVHPSLYEGFGLPPLEAMAAGVPTIVSRVASLPEVCGDATVYFEPRDVDGLAHQLERVLLDGALREHLVRAGRERARKFDWDAAAERTADVLERAL